MSRFLHYSFLSNISQLVIVVKNYTNLLQTHNHGKTIKRIFSKEIARLLRGFHSPWSQLCLLKVSISISQKAFDTFVNSHFVSSLLQFCDFFKKYKGRAQKPHQLKQSVGLCLKLTVSSGLF